MDDPLPGQPRDKYVEVPVAVPAVEVGREENRDAENIGNWMLNIRNIGNIRMEMLRILGGNF